jgi:selenocysteine lyase/cysteine desulfurase
MPVNFGLLGVDMLSVSAHKLGGPQGVGALVIRDGLSVSPLIAGGGQELRRRAGTENVAAIAGFAAAVQAATAKMNLISRACANSLNQPLKQVRAMHTCSPRPLTGCPTPCVLHCRAWQLIRRSSRSTWTVSRCRPARRARPARWRQATCLRRWGQAAIRSHQPSGSAWGGTALRRREQVYRKLAAHCRETSRSRCSGLSELREAKESHNGRFGND